MAHGPLVFSVAPSLRGLTVIENISVKLMMIWLGPRETLIVSMQLV